MRRARISYSDRIEPSVADRVGCGLERERGVAVVEREHGVLHEPRARVELARRRSVILLFPANLQAHVLRAAAAVVVAAHAGIERP